MVAVGLVTVGGQQYLQCAATQLTAFLGSLSPSQLQLDVNVVHPIDDVGSLEVSLRFHGGTASHCDSRPNAQTLRQ